jgi:hypothetical protein
MWNVLKSQAKVHHEITCLSSSLLNEVEMLWTLALTRGKLPMANIINDLICYVYRQFQQYFSYIMTTQIILSNYNLHRWWKACDLSFFFLLEIKYAVVMSRWIYHRLNLKLMVLSFTTYLSLSIYIKHLCIERIHYNWNRSVWHNPRRNQ